MKPIRKLIWIFRAFALLFIVFALWGIGVATITGTGSFREYLEGILILMNGIVLWGLTIGLAKQRKWAWYVALVIIVLPAISIIRGLFSGTSFISISFSGLIFLLLFGLLMLGRKPFLEQPKEQFSILLREPLFVLVVGGFFLIALVTSGVLLYEFSNRMKIQRNPETLQDKPVTLERYKNEKYGFDLQYPTDKIAIENDYETERLSDNPTLLFDVFFYDSNYGINTAQTKSVPVLTIEIFECGEKSMHTCNFEAEYGPSRYYGVESIRGGASSGSFNDFHANKWEIAWGLKEMMKGIVVLKNQRLYAVLGRTEATRFKPLPEATLDQILSTFRFLD